MEAETCPDGPTVLLSYDVPGEDRSLAVRVCRLVFGRADAPRTAPAPYAHRPGVVWVGQSVLLLPRPAADELAARLRGLGVTVSTAAVRIEPGELTAFRLPRSGEPRRERRAESISSPKALDGP